MSDVPLCPECETFFELMNEGSFHARISGKT